MPEPSYGLIVEGIYDESVFRELVGKIVASDVTIEVRPCGGVTRLRTRFPGFLRELEHAVQGKPVGKALVCAVQQETETWLLADVNAINSVAEARGGRRVPPVQDPPEQIENPKQRLSRLLSSAGLPYDQKVCGEIARRADIEVLRHRCPSFRLFERKVLDC